MNYLASGHKNFFLSDNKFTCEPSCNFMAGIVLKKGLSATKPHILKPSS